MNQPVCSNEDFVALFEQYGAAETSRRLNVRERSVLARRANLEKIIGRQITGPPHSRQTRHNVSYPGRLEFTIDDGVILVGSDAHYWPGPPSTAHRAFVRACKELQPKLVVMNGDVIDGSTISRHPPLGWEKRPSLFDEIQVARERLDEIRKATPRDSPTIWPCGNHDARLETRIATILPELAKLQGTSLKNHFGQEWEPCWSCWVNDSVVIKHRHRAGIHAVHNSTLWAGKTMVTGHLHSLKITPLSDYNGTRYGIDTGTLADPYGPQFAYTEDNPRNHRSGFVVLTFKDGMLLWPEVTHVLEDSLVEFRGKTYRV